MAQTFTPPKSLPRGKFFRVKLSRDDGPGRRDGHVIDDDGARIGTAHDFTYGGAGFAIHATYYSGYAHNHEIDFV